MPTYREDLHLGHKVPTVEADDITDLSITTEKIADGAVTTPKIADKAVTTEKIADGAVTSDKIAKRAVGRNQLACESVDPTKITGNFVPEVVQPVVDKLEAKHNKDIKDLKDKDTDLQQQIKSLTLGGVVLKQCFGSEEYFGISQKVLTDAINRLWDKLEEITGEALHGIDMTINPPYFIGDSGCDVTIAATMIGAGVTDDDTLFENHGIFEKISFYANGELMTNEQGEEATAENVEKFSFTTHIDETTTIVCKANIMGIEYTRTGLITKYNAFFMLPGNFDTLAEAVAYAEENAATYEVQVDGNMRANANITCEAGDYIYVIIDSNLRDGFIRADLNSVEIPFEADETVGDYTVLKSSNAYQAGTYNIDING